MAEKKEKIKKEKAPKDFKLIKAIRAEKDYKSKSDEQLHQFQKSGFN